MKKLFLMLMSALAVAVSAPACNDVNDGNDGSEQNGGNNENNNGGNNEKWPDVTDNPADHELTIGNAEFSIYKQFSIDYAKAEIEINSTSEQLLWLTARFELRDEEGNDIDIDYDARMESAVSSYNAVIEGGDEDAVPEWEQRLRRGSMTVTETLLKTETDYAFCCCYVTRNPETGLIEAASKAVGKILGTTPAVPKMPFQIFQVQGSAQSTSCKWWSHPGNNGYQDNIYFCNLVKSDELAGSSVEEYAAQYFDRLKAADGYSETETGDNGKPLFGGLFAGSTTHEFDNLTPATNYTVFAAFVKNGAIISPVQSAEFTTAK